MTDDAEKNTPALPENDTNPVFEQLQQSEDVVKTSSGEVSMEDDQQKSLEIAQNKGTEEKENFQKHIVHGKFASHLDQVKKLWQSAVLFTQNIGKEEKSLFHFLYTSKQEEGVEDGLIQNIVSRGQDEQQKGKQRDAEDKKIDFTEAHELSPEEIAQQKVEKKRAEELLRFSKVLVLGSLVVPVVSLLLSSLLLSTSGLLSSLLEDRNYALSFREKTEELHRVKTFISSQEQAIQDMNDQIAEIKENKILAVISDRRIQWREVFERINQITDTAFEGNKISKYVIFNNYSGSSKDETISVDGNVRSLVGASWQDLIKLRNVLSADENFETEEIYFRQFVKQKTQSNSQITTSEYMTPFNLTFKYIRESEEEGKDDAENMHASQ